MTSIRDGVRLVAAALFALGTVHAQTGYSSGFEGLTALPSGSALWDIALPPGTLGQDGYYYPIGTTSIPLSAYTYGGNTLGVPQNPNGGGIFVAGNGPGAGTFARAQRDFSYGLDTGYWTYGADLLVQYTGALPATQNIGSLSAQPFPGGQTFIMLLTWVDLTTAAAWNMSYVWFDSVGTQLQVNVADAAFQNLALNTWYRWETVVDLTTNQIVELRIRNLSTNAYAVNNPVGAYLFGGAAPAPAINTGYRLFAGGGNAGNIIAWDNVAVVPGWVQILPPQPGPCPGPCCLPVDSLRVGGIPRIGDTISHLADLPAGGAAPFSFALLAHSLTQGISPCGIPLPGVTGNVLIGLPAGAISVGGPWIGPGSPVVFSMLIPLSNIFVGVNLYSQAAFLDPVSIPVTQETRVVVGG